MTTLRRVAAVFVGVCAGIGPAGAAVADGRGGDGRSRIETRHESLAANATLTDCPLGGPAGHECTAWVVFAGRDDGDGPAFTFLNVDRYDIVLTEGSFTATPAGSGSTIDADVSVDEGLDRARASGVVELQSCGPDPTTCTSVGSVDVDVAWDGVGRVTKDRFRDRRESDGCRFRIDGRTKDRAATVAATVDGVPTPNASLPEFAPSITASDVRTKVDCR